MSITSSQNLSIHLSQDHLLVGQNDQNTENSQNEQNNTLKQSGQSIIVKFEVKEEAKSSSKTETNTTNRTRSDSELEREALQEFESELKVAHETKSPTIVLSPELQVEFESDVKEVKSDPKPPMEMKAIVVKGEKTMEKVDVASTNVKKDVAQKGDDAPKVEKKTTLLGSIKNFFVGIYEKFTESKIDTIYNHSMYPGGRVVEGNRGSGATALRELAQGKYSLAGGEPSKESRPLTSFGQINQQQRAMSRVLDAMIETCEKDVKKSGVGNWLDRAVSQITAEISNKAGTIASRQQILSMISGALDRPSGDPELQSKRDQLRSALKKETPALTEPSAMKSSFLESFDTNLDDQIKSPGSFFRETEGEMMPALIKMDSPKMGDHSKALYKAVIEEYTHPETGRAKELQGLKGDELRIARDKIAVELAVKVVNLFLGSTKEDRKEFAEKFLGTDTREALREADRKIKDYDEKKVSKEVKAEVLDSWNSNNFILRGLAETVIGLSVELTMSGNKEGATMIVRVQDILTQAANNVSGDKQKREFVGEPGFKQLAGQIPTMLSDVISGC